MNIREGVRRIGIILGAAGAVCGLVLASAIVLKEVQNAWTHHEFMNLASSAAIRQRLANWDWFDRNAPPDSNGGLTIDIGEGGVARVHLADGIFSFTPEQEAAIRELNSRPKESMSPQRQAILAELNRRMALHAYKVVTDGGTYTLHTLAPIPASIESIEKLDGTILSRDTNLTLWRSVVALLAVVGLPLAGYFLPVGASRLIMWVADGFASTQQT